MLKEIWEQPNALRTCIRGRLNTADKDVLLSGIIDHKEKFINCKRIIICACGTSWHSALIGKYFIEEACQIPVEVEYASEFRYRNPVIRPDDIVIAVSQSGETADTLAAKNFLNMNGAEISKQVQDSLEGNMREVIGSLSLCATSTLTATSSPMKS